LIKTLQNQLLTVDLEGALTNRTIQFSKSKRHFCQNCFAVASTPHLGTKNLTAEFHWTKLSLSVYGLQSLCFNFETATNVNRLSPPSLPRTTAKGEKDYQTSAIMQGFFKIIFGVLETT